MKIAEIVLDTHVKLGEMLEIRPTTSSWVGTSRPLPEGITKKQSHQAQQLAKHKDVVKEVKEKAREDDRPFPSGTHRTECHYLEAF